MGGGGAPYFITQYVEPAPTKKPEPTSSLDWVKGEKMPDDVKSIRIQKSSAAAKLKPAGRVMSSTSTKSSAKGLPSLQRALNMEVEEPEGVSVSMDVDLFPRHRDITEAPPQVGKSLTPASTMESGRLSGAASQRPASWKPLESLGLMDVEEDEPPSLMSVGEIGDVAIPMSDAGTAIKNSQRQPLELPTFSATRVESKTPPPVEYGQRQPPIAREPAEQVAGSSLPSLSGGAKLGQARRGAGKSFGLSTALPEPQTKPLLPEPQTRPEKRRISVVEDAGDPYDELFTRGFEGREFTFSSGIQLPPTQTHRATWPEAPRLWPAPDVPTIPVGVDRPAHELTGTMEVDNLDDMRIKRTHAEVTKDVIRKQIKRPKKQQKMTPAPTRQIELDGKTVWI